MRKDHLLSKLIIVVTGLSLLYGCNELGPGKSAIERQKSGIEFYKKGEFGKAENEFKGAVNIDETLATSFYYLALLNEKDKKYIAMRENLKKTVDLAPDNIDARVKLGRVNLLFNELDEALNQANEVLKQSNGNLEGATIKAATYIKQNKQGDALAIIDEILKSQPQYVEAISLKALILMQNQQFDSALTLINPAIISGVDDIALYLLKIQLDAKKKNIDAVISDYERLVNLYPEKREFKYALAKIYTEANRSKEAENLIRREVNLTPLDIKPKLVLLELLYTLGIENAVKQINEYEIEFQNEPEILLKISQWLLSKRRLSMAENLLSNIQNIESNNLLKQQVTLLLAKIAFHHKNLMKSKKLVSELIDINYENQQALMLLAKINMAEEQYDDAVTLLKKIKWKSGNLDKSLVLLAQIDLLKGDREKADKKFRQALEVNPVNIKALTSVINQALVENNFSYASGLLTKALKLQPNNLDFLKMSVDIKMAARDWDGAKEILLSLEKQSRGDPLTKFLVGRVHQEKGEYIKAVSVYKDLLNILPDYPDALREMAICYELMQKRSEMIQYMTSFLDKHPENIAAYLVMGQLFLLDKKIDEAVATYNKALAINKQDPHVYSSLAMVYSQQNEFQKAIKVYEKGLEVFPNNVRLSIYLASVYEAVDEFEKAINLYVSLLSIDPKLEIAINNYAALLVDHYGDIASLEKARELVVNFKNSDNPFYLDSFAWIEFKLGNIKDAIPKLEKVNSMAEVAVFKFHLGVAYHQQGDEAGAVEYLQQAVDLGMKKGGFEEIKMAKQLLDKLLMSNKL